MPVDPAPVPPALLAEARGGNLVLWFEVNERNQAVGGQNVSYATMEQQRDPAVPLWRSHFATCPNASSHHGRGAA